MTAARPIVPCDGCDYGEKLHGTEHVWMGSGLYEGIEYGRPCPRACQYLADWIEALQGNNPSDCSVCRGSHGLERKHPCE
jgi:hypothetical protein